MCISDCLWAQRPRYPLKIWIMRSRIIWRVEDEIVCLWVFLDRLKLCDKVNVLSRHHVFAHGFCGLCQACKSTNSPHITGKAQGCQGSRWSRMGCMQERTLQPSACQGYCSTRDASWLQTVMTLFLDNLIFRMKPWYAMSGITYIGITVCTHPAGRVWSSFTFCAQ